jgi:hypothetical protein
MPATKTATKAAMADAKTYLTAEAKTHTTADVKTHTAADAIVNTTIDAAINMIADTTSHTASETTTDKTTDIIADARTDTMKGLLFHTTDSSPTSARDRVQSSDSDQMPSSPTNATPQTDNFYSPENYAFYTLQPYKSFDKHERMIRLLVVTKGKSGKIRCRLTDAKSLVDADGTYTAISYCAGDPKKTRIVLVNGIPFNAFANLAHAIEETYRYRSAVEGSVKVLLWADQICINQSDKAERSHQVGFMYDIYRSARRVAVCLSTDEQRGGSAIPWIIHTWDDLFGRKLR